MKNYFEFDEEDKKLWRGIALAGVIYIVAFSLFWGGWFHQIERVTFTLLVIFLPGYSILKLFLDKVRVSDNVIADKIMLSFGLSIASMIVPYYLLTYLRPYVFNTDEEGWGERGILHQFAGNTGVTVILLLAVLGVAFGVKFYLNKKKGIAQ
jgi:uncharacterized membrane protein